MKKSVMKILSILLVALLLISIFSTVFAAGTDGYLNPKSYGGQPTDAANNVQSITNMVLGVVQVIGVAVAVIMLIALAIKYMIASPSEKADVKKGAIIYVVAALMLFAATGILQLVKSFAGSISEKTGSIETVQVAKLK